MYSEIQQVNESKNSQQKCTKDSIAKDNELDNSESNQKE